MNILRERCVVPVSITQRTEYGRQRPTPSSCLSVS